MPVATTRGVVAILAGRSGKRNSDMLRNLMLRNAIWGAGFMLCLGAVAPACAQAPSTAQRNAIRQSCRADYEAMCASIPPGGSASLQCLRQNMASLSPACQSAVGAISGGGQSSPRAPMAAAPAARPAQACRADYREFCGGIRPGGGRAMMCLRRHAAELSPECQESLASLRR
jgi:hypothetical protein